MKTIHMSLATALFSCLVHGAVALADPPAATPSASEATTAATAAATATAAKTTAAEAAVPSSPIAAPAAAASQPVTGAAPAAAGKPAAGTAPTSTVQVSAARSGSQLTSEQLEKHFKTEGYRTRSQNGQKYFCRDAETVGSRISKEACFTEDQLVRMENVTPGTSASMGNNSGGPPPPIATRGGAR